MNNITFNLHFTDLCDFSCKHCFVTKQGKELSLKEICCIVDKIAIYAYETKTKVRINLAGGEPLISKNIQSIIDYIYSKEIEVSIITNGNGLTKQFIEHNKDKLSMIGISIDSLKHDTNCIMERCEKGKTISEEEMVEKCLWIKTNGIKLKINTCITSLNKDENLCEFYKKVNPNRIKILRVLSDKPKDNLYVITDKEWENVQRKYKDLGAVFEDNDYMRENYIIIDSSANLTKNNLHYSNNSLLNKDIYECLKSLNKVKEG